ncbi:hypothetical protein PG995_006460 [Apiospora arundinis]
MDFSNTTSRINSSPNLLWNDAALYSGSCGVTDPTIRELDQQIILSDMILSANGGIPYMIQDPGLQSNLSAVHAHPLTCGKQAVPPIVHVPTAAAVGTPMVGYEPYGVTIKPPPPLPETRHNPTDPRFNQQPAGGVLEVTGWGQAAATSQPSPASDFSSTAHASEWDAPRQDVYHHPENWRSAIPTAQQKKKRRDQSGGDGSRSRSRSHSDNESDSDITAGRRTNRGQDDGEGYVHRQEGAGTDGGASTERRTTAANDG